ncbi:MAG: DNA methyltransferase [Planctomycetota bacterium]|nr:DNA methyltransferase [Planctomycetota bacterium]
MKTDVQQTRRAHRALSSSVLNIENKTRGNLLPWRGQFSPQLIQAFLKEYASPDSHVFDPFAGSGTVLHECGLLNLRCSGTDLNPAAYHLAKAYEMLNIPLDKRRIALEHIGNFVEALTYEPMVLFGEVSRNEESNNLTKDILDLYLSEESPLHRSLWESLIILLDFFNKEPTPSHALHTWRKLRELIEKLPYAESKIDVEIADARTPPVDENSIDLIVTSPPYINVFNYHQQYRRSVEALGWKPLIIAGSEFGANRKFRGNRFLTVIQYCLDMRQALEAFHAICRDDAHLIFVLGRESNVRKTAFKNGDIFRELATKCSCFENPLNQERVFRNKFGKWIYEDIIHLSPTPNGRKLGDPRAIAVCALKSALAYAPNESKDDLLASIKAADSVKPSPIFVPKKASKYCCNRH